MKTFNAADHDKFDKPTALRPSGNRVRPENYFNTCPKEQAIEDCWAWTIFGSMFTLPSIGLYVASMPWPALLFAVAAMTCFFAAFMEFRVSKNFR